MVLEATLKQDLGSEYSIDITLSLNNLVDLENDGKLLIPMEVLRNSRSGEGSLLNLNFCDSTDIGSYSCGLVGNNVDLYLHLPKFSKDYFQRSKYLSGVPTIFTSYRAGVDSLDIKTRGNPLTITISDKEIDIYKEISNNLFLADQIVEKTFSNTINYLFSLKQKIKQISQYPQLN